jgi:hypothetical protein
MKNQEIRMDVQPEFTDLEMSRKRLSTEYDSAAAGREDKKVERKIRVPETAVWSDNYRTRAIITRS